MALILSPNSPKVTEMIPNCLHLIVAAALALTSPLLPAQAPVVTYTSPSGYVKHDFKLGFNLVAVGVHHRTTLKGEIDSEDGAEITDNDASFDTALGDPNATYLLEITEGPQDGAVAEIVSFTATTVTLGDALTAGNVSYRIRPAQTLDELFGDKLKGSTTDTAADTVWILKSDGSGTYTRYFYSTIFNGFRDADDDFGNPPKPFAVFYPDAMFVQIQDTPVTITFFGDVKVTPTVVSASNGFNLVRVSSPVGQTLAESKLQDFLTASTTDTAADTVWIQDGAGGYVRYFFSTIFDQWRDADDDFGSEDKGTTVLPSAVLIQRVGSNTAGLFELPDYFNNF